MMSKSKLALALASAFIAQAALAVTPEFHGYLRSGSGAASEGGREACYGLVGINGIMGGKVANAGRLGNECETYGELSFDAGLGDNAGMKFNLHTMLAFVVKQEGDFEQFSPAWRQTWVEASNIGSGALEHASAWVGKRYYKRHDVHIVDFFWSEDQGPGAGIENIDVGGGLKLSYALMRNNNDSEGSAKAMSNHDFRLEGFQTNPGGKIDLSLNLVQKNTVDGVNGKSGVAFGIAHNQDDPFGLGGFNDLVFQYAKDSATLSQGAAFVDSNSSKRGWRVVEHLMFEPKNSNWNGAVFVGYGRNKENNGGDNKLFSAVARPIYHFTDAYSLAMEVGTTRFTPDGGDTQTINKLTIAPQLAVGRGFWSRPVLRAYYTYANWNDAAKKAGNVASGHESAAAYATRTSGSSYGFQAEAWW